MSGANPLRGEVSLPLRDGARLLRPSFEALVAAEAELGSLFQLLDRVVGGQVQLAEMSGLFWHCLGDRAAGEGRGDFEAALLREGLGGLLPAYRALLAAVFKGVA